MGVGCVPKSFFSSSNKCVLEQEEFFIVSEENSTHPLSSCPCPCGRLAAFWPLCPTAALAESLNLCNVYK